MELAQVRQLDCWLAGRLRRASLEHGQVLELALQPGQQGLLLVELQPEVGQDWLVAVHELLNLLLASVGGQLRDSPLLGHDPQPSALLDSRGRPLELNEALMALLEQLSLVDASSLLPVSHSHLVQACLAQQRAIENVEVQVAEQILIWTFIPDPKANRVLARCRQATAQILAERESAKARRLYRLITEKYHRPDFPTYPGRLLPRCVTGFLDLAWLLAAGAAWASGPQPVSPTGPG
nr:hypothetical protein GCM10020185_85370 [Pseudomonas brassicacearum subsp. brassicacearum]